jgi:hypothetical protein
MNTNMNMTMTIIRGILPVLAFLSCHAMLTAAQTQPVYSVKKIWSSAPHNAFTDLMEYEGQYYCTFREGTGHIPARDGTGDGKIRILVSPDGNKWKSAALIAKKGLDLRDPKLSITPDGRLMVSIGASVYKNGQLMSRSPYVSFKDKNAKIFSDPQPVMVDSRIQFDKNWLWRVTWDKDAGYGVVYQQHPPGEEWKVFLVKTPDGINYELVTRLDVPGNPNEAAVEIPENNKMRIIIRRGAGNGWLGYSEKDYTKWKWDDLGIRLGGPGIITLPNGKTIIASRAFGEKTNTTFNARTALFTLDENGRAVQLLELPSGKDTSYPGLLVNKDELWMSYYSGHEGQTSIYFAKIKYESLFASQFE